MDNEPARWANAGRAKYRPARRIPPMAAEPNDDERARALAEVERDYPGWHAWPGVLAGVVYARRPRSPPLVVRAVSPAGLRRAIEAAEAERD